MKSSIPACSNNHNHRWYAHPRKVLLQALNLCHSITRTALRKTDKEIRLPLTRELFSFAKTEGETTLPPLPWSPSPYTGEAFFFRACAKLARFIAGPRFFPPSRTRGCFHALKAPKQIPLPKRQGNFCFFSLYP